VPAATACSRLRVALLFRRRGADLQGACGRKDARGLKTPLAALASLRSGIPRQRKESLREKLACLRRASSDYPHVVLGGPDHLLAGEVVDHV
jgi:hypothetical protein